jgi:hypothetical protein
LIIDEKVKKCIYDYLEKQHGLSFRQLEPYFFSFGQNKELIILQTPYVIREEGQSIVLRWEISLTGSLKIESVRVVDLGENKLNFFDLSAMIPSNDYEAVKNKIVEVMNKNSLILMEPISDFDSLLNLFLVEIILQENGTRVILRSKSTCVKEVDFFYSNNNASELIINLPNHGPD